ncbi:hypothetical protein VC218_11410 [Xanthomonas nasturtii]|uniref:hypothetical protein n=1 Tax=Xanthomonas nasturtii TaxID=1843581 RepID=UPI002B22E2A6|nr:hypothetical protein [Xanthomonas nasturtii]MEA9579494.1 hypothetical protein [Xanthomonas nasturtii]
MTEFSIAHHVLFLSGYLDAVARSITTESMLCNISVHFSAPDSNLNRAHGAKAIESWSTEFGSFADTFLAIDQQSRLGFYLVDYICWLRDFTTDAKCYKSHSNAPACAMTFHIEWPDGSYVVIAADKASREILKN